MRLLQTYLLQRLNLAEPVSSNIRSLTALLPIQSPLLPIHLHPQCPSHKVTMKYTRHPTQVHVYFGVGLWVGIGEGEWAIEQQARLRRARKSNWGGKEKKFGVQRADTCLNSHIALIWVAVNFKRKSLNSHSPGTAKSLSLQNFPRLAFKPLDFTHGDQSRTLSITNTVQWHEESSCVATELSRSIKPENAGVRQSDCCYTNRAAVQWMSGPYPKGGHCPESRLRTWMQELF